MASVGSRGDSFDNALAETVIGLYKSELITIAGAVAHRRGRRARDPRLGALWNTGRLHSSIGNVPPAEFERAWLVARDIGETHNEVLLPELVT